MEKGINTDSTKLVLNVILCFLFLSTVLDQ